MVETLEQSLRRALASKPLLLMAHLVAGYPSFDDNLHMLEAMREGGVDLVEVQFPFSEPVADGPVFARANQTALERGTRVSACFDLMARARNILPGPLLMMGYCNTVFHMGEGRFLEKLAAVGAAGFILADLPPELGADLYGRAQALGMSGVLILTPNTTLERKREVARQARGLIYCAARKGVTGLKTDFGGSVEDFLRDVGAVSPLPRALGFGVRAPADVAFLRGKAEMAVVGTAALETYERGGARALADFYRRLQEGVLTGGREA